MARPQPCPMRRASPRRAGWRFFSGVCTGGGRGVEPIFMKRGVAIIADAPIWALMDQPSLFDRPVLSGLSQAGGIIAPVEERGLTAAIDAAGLSPFQFHGWQGKRLTRSFGWRYDFDDASLTRSDPIPDWLLPLRERAARFAALLPDALVQALVIRYDPGATIGWHRDRPVFEHVLG